MIDHRETIIARILSYDADNVATHLGVPITNIQVQQRTRTLGAQYGRMNMEELRRIEQDYISRREAVALAEQRCRRISALKKKAAIAGALLGAGVVGDIAGIDKQGSLEYTVIALSELVGAVGLAVNAAKLYLAQRDAYRP